MKSISIHAPPRGATERLITAEAERNISIHAPPRGATTKHSKIRLQRIHFNSRPSARGDGLQPSDTHRHGISIHAPPRGATRKTSKHRKNNLFQFTPLREGRLLTVSAACSPFLFQFTPLREGRRCCLWRRGLHRAFQFTPLREGRRARERKQTNILPFQFTPLREGRLCSCSRLPRRNISIHAPPRGATKSSKRIVCCRLFQFTPLREGRRKQNGNRGRGIHFNSRPSARGDPACRLFHQVL